MVLCKLNSNRTDERLGYLGQPTVWLLPAFIHLPAELQTTFVAAFLKRKARGSQTRPPCHHFLPHLRSAAFSSDRQAAFQQPLACCSVIKTKKSRRAAGERKQSPAAVTKRPTSSPASFPPFVLMAPGQRRRAPTSAGALSLSWERLQLADLFTLRLEKWRNVTDLSQGCGRQEAFPTAHRPVCQTSPGSVGGGVRADVRAIVWPSLEMV